MSLTTEQKINLLILAGFEPKKWVCGSEREPRIGKIGGRAVLYGQNHGQNHGRNTAWTYSSSFGHNEYYRAVWEDMQLDTCPDDLIYKAIEASHADN